MAKYPPTGAHTRGCQFKFYGPDQRCAHHSDSVGHDTKDCINLKHKIKDFIDQDMVSLNLVALNVTNNTLPNNGGSNVSIIETDDDWCGMKVITPIVHECSVLKRQRE